MNGEPGTALGEDLARRIGAEVDAGFDAQLAFLQELVRRPSVRGQEHLAQDLMFQAMRERGYEMDRWRVDPKDIEPHPGFSPVAVDYAHAWHVVGPHRPRKAVGSSLVLDRQSVVWGKSVSVRVDLGGRRMLKQTKRRNVESRSNE